MTDGCFKTANPAKKIDTISNRAKQGNKSQPSDSHPNGVLSRGKLVFRDLVAECRAKRTIIK